MNYGGKIKKLVADIERLIQLTQDIDTLLYDLDLTIEEVDRIAELLSTSNLSSGKLQSVYQLIEQIQAAFQRVNAIDIVETQTYEDMGDSVIPASSSEVNSTSSSVIPATIDLGTNLYSDSSFEAYPVIADTKPSVLKRGDVYPLTVGFTSEIPENMQATQLIRISDPLPNEKLTVVMKVRGAKLVTLTGQLSDTASNELDLEVDSTVIFECHVNNDADMVKATASYYRGNQIVGNTEKHFNVIGGESFDALVNQARVCPMDFTSDDSVDMTIVLHKLDNESLQWSYIAYPYIPFTTVPFSPKVGNSIRAANCLNDNLKNVGFEGIFADAELWSLGEDITRLIPKEIFEALKTVNSKLEGHPPRLMLYTDETSIPWELAHLETGDLLSPSRPPYLGAQTMMGRWYIGHQVPYPPPATIEFDEITIFGGVENLPQTFEERNNLKTAHNCKDYDPFKADFADFISSESWISKDKRNFLHFAVHGISSGMRDDAVIIFEQFKDGSDTTEPFFIRPSYFRLDFECGASDVSQLQGVFLNACQTASAGSNLGQLAGFPGEFIPNGVGLFLAPLWEVRDTYARQFAEKFYKLTLSEGKTVGEALYELRGSYVFQMDKENSYKNIEALAYIYYGNPNLRMTNLAKEYNQ